MTLLSNDQVVYLARIVVRWTRRHTGRSLVLHRWVAGADRRSGQPLVYRRCPRRLPGRHGWFIATSGGQVFQAGPSKQMNWITTGGSGSITPAGTRGNSADAMNGNAVYYTTHKIITLGGTPDYQDSYATDKAYTIEITSGTPHVKQVGSMNNARTFANSVVLPNGEDLTVGGENYGVPFSDATRS